MKTSNWIKLILIQLLTGLLFLELFSFLGSKAQIFLVNDTPSIYQNAVNIHEARTEKEAWGAWRQINSINRQVSACYDVEIKTNEIGARDGSFKQLVGKNVILLGDSFAEAVGVEYRQTAQYILEQKIGKNILNFGIAGSFGPLQEYLIYKNLARQFEHESVLVFVLPANDFIDNDKSHWEDPDNRIRYRPYFSSKDDPLIPWYFPEAIPTDTYGEYLNAPSTNGETLKNTRMISLIKNFIVENLWLSNPLRTLSYIVTKRDLRQGSYYLSASEKQQKNLVNAYTGIAKEAAGKAISFVIIPTQRDFDLLKNNEDQLNSQYWYKSLKDLAYKSRGFFIDLINYRVEDIGSLFLSCDPHWSPLGNKWAAEIISNKLSKH